MKIALLWPDSWPYIRRGTERMVHDIATHLAGQGHDVHVLASKPGRGAVRREGRVTTFLLPQREHPLLLRHRAVPRFDAHGFQVAPILLRERYDLVHCFMYTYAPSVRLAKALRGTPYVYHVVTIPPRWDRPADGWMLRRALHGAAAVRVFSRWCAEHMRDRWGIAAHVVPPAVDAEHFAPVAPRDLRRVRVVFTGDLAEPRKNAHLVVRAFNAVHRRHPEAALILAGPAGFDLPATYSRLARLIETHAQPAVEFAGPGALAALPATYAAASATVLPASGEPFGMVLTESLSCGTPVVAARSGAIPEIVTAPEIGTLFDLAETDAQSAERLAAAIERTLELARDPQTLERCRRHARTWTWESVGAAFEALHDAALGTARPGKRAA